MKILYLSTIIVVLIQISFLEFNIGFFYYGVILFSLIILLLVGKKIKFNYLIIWLLVSGFLSIIVNDIPSFFQPYQRLIAFILVMGLIGPFISNTGLSKFRSSLFNNLNKFILILVLSSFIGIVLGWSVMIGRGGYAGFFNHSMMLGPFASIAMLVSFNQAYIRQNKNIRLIFFCFAFFAFITCVASGSRSSLLSGVIGALFFFYKLYQGSLKHFARNLIVFIFIGVSSFPIWETYTERIMEKMIYSGEKGDLLVTRAALWNIRVQEFTSSVIFGVGFASVDSSILENRFDPSEGKVEPGSSWLAVLSMTGLLGFFPLFFLLYNYFSFLLKEKNNLNDSAFLGSLLILFIIHMMAEGYIFSAGSGLFFYFWMILGNIENLKRKSIVIK